MEPVITTGDSRHKTTPDQVILDVEGARDVGPTESAGLIRECLALTYKRLDAAIWRALDELSGTAPEIPGAASPESPSGAQSVRIGHAVRSERSKFFPRFRSEFDQLFQNRQQGKPREHGQRGPQAATLALVEEHDLTGQVSLKSAVKAMRAATRDDGFGFDLRARIVMREQPSEGEYENPWGADLVCDALGNTCRALWATDDAWRSIMEHLVIALTPEIAALHRELDALLQDRDILPVLRVHARKRGPAARVAQTNDASLYDKLVELLGRDTPVAPGLSAAAAQAGSAMPSDMALRLPIGDPIFWRMQVDAQDSGASRWQSHSGPWSSLLHALNLLERGPGGAAARAVVHGGDDLVASSGGTASDMSALTNAAADRGRSAIGRVTIEVLSAVLDEIFDNPYLPPEIKTVFGRMQIPMLKAALSEPQMLSQPRHRVRRFFDTLAAASVGLRPENSHDAQFIGLANHLASIIRDQFADNLEIFDTARDELEVFLDAERAAYNENLVQVLPSLIALDDHAVAQANVRTVIAIRLAGRNVPPEIRAFLDQEGLARMVSAHMRDGPHGPAWKGELQMVDDLLWSISPEPGPEARRRLVQLIPRLVRKVGEDWPADQEACARREAFLARLYEMHIEAIKSLSDLAAGGGESGVAGLSATTAAGDSSLPESAESASGESAENVDDVDMLMRGDWCLFREPDVETPILARFAWRAPRGTQLLFTHRDGATAFIHTPKSLARAFALGRASVAVEAVPLFERAMERMAERLAEPARSPDASSTLATGPG